MAEEDFKLRLKVKVLIAQLCSILCDPMDCSSSESFVHGILQAKILEWVAIAISRGSSQTKDLTQVSSTAGWSDAKADVLLPVGPELYLPCLTQGIRLTLSVGLWW